MRSLLIDIQLLPLPPATASILLHLVALAGGFVVSAALIPFIIRLSVKHHWLDVPDARRIHTRPVPRLGGVAIFIATCTVAGILMAVAAAMGGVPIGYPRLLPGLVLGATIVFLTGLVDDIRGISPAGKLVAQTVAALIVVGFGFQIESIALFENAPALSLGFLAIPLTLLWIVGMTNAFNLIDGADGLAGTMALIALAIAVSVDILQHDTRALLISVSMMGAVLGFLRFNNTPARIFLGDSGSMTLGFFLAIRLVLASTTTERVLYALVPMFALAFPLLDTSIAIARRWLRGHPFSRADGRHIHHQLLALGLSTRRTVDLLGAFFAAVAVLGVFVVFASPRYTVALMLGAATLAFTSVIYGTRWLRYSEFAELGASISSVLRNARHVVQEKLRANEVAERIRAAQTLEQVREALSDLEGEARVLDVELVRGDVRLHGPDRQQISPVNQLPLRLDYPFAWESPDGVHELILRVWSTRPSKGGHPAMERLASRIGPALEDWFTAHPAASKLEERRAADVTRPSDGRKRLSDA